jgi:hypothetical protein
MSSNQLRVWPQIGPVRLTATGTQHGLLTIEHTVGLFIGRDIVLTGSGQKDKHLRVKRIVSPTQIIVGPRDEHPATFSSCTFYSPSNNSAIISYEYIHDPDKENGDVMNAAFERLPTGAIRTTTVSPLGNDVNTPQGAIETFEPDTRLVYGPCCELKEIREWVPLWRIIDASNVTISGNTFTFSTATMPQWLKKDMQFVVVTGGGSNVEQVFTLQSIVWESNSFTVVESPAAFSGAINIDFGLNEPLKITKFKYGSTASLTKLETRWGRVTKEDILNK